METKGTPLYRKQLPESEIVNICKHLIEKNGIQGIEGITGILYVYYYADACIDYGQLVKIRKNGRVVRKEKMTIYDNPDPGDIETTDVENYNGILRACQKITYRIFSHHPVSYSFLVQ